MVRNIIVCVVINCYEVNVENVGIVLNYGKIF